MTLRVVFFGLEFVFFFCSFRLDTVLDSITLCSFLWTQQWQQIQLPITSFN
jgi:hypothetical protein